MESGRSLGPAPQDASIVLEGVTKGFGEAPVVADLTFSIRPGQIFGLIGPSGSGKTTAVRMVIGVHAPDSGRVTVLGREPRRFDNRIRARLGFMPQHFVLYPELSVRENLDFIASCYGVPLRGRAARLTHYLDFVELLEARDTPAGNISGGMQRRLELACALVHEPDVLVFDEPTAEIDPVLRQKFWDHFRSLRDQGRTLLVTTQYVTESEYCDEVAVPREGRLIAIGAPDAVRRAAMGGEIIDVSADGLTRDHLAQIEAIDGVLRVQQSSADEVRILVEDASTAMPAIVATLQDAGIIIENVTHYQPNFDEVFVLLMEAAQEREKSPAAGRRDGKR